MNEETIYYCSCCDFETTDESELTHTADGEHVCESCLDDGYMYCDDCEQYYPNNEMNETVKDYHYICDECARFHYTQCGDCGKWVHDDYRIDISDRDYYICPNCYDRGGYFTCEGCGEIFTNDRYGSDGYCCDCETSDDESNNHIHNYSYKPTPTFYKGVNERTAKRLYMGIELEYENSSYSDKNNSVEIWENNQNDESFYFKEDGSLDCGFEAVSHPRTLQSWNEYREELDALFYSLQSATNIETRSNTGLHIHVSKKGMTDLHKVRLFAFVGLNKANCSKIARRQENNWSKIKIAKKGDLRKDAQNKDRYEALNWLPLNTVEFRLFKSTLSVFELFTCLQFCHASYQFTKSHISIASIVNGDSWEAFKVYVEQEQKAYPDLNKYIHEYM